VELLVLRVFQMEIALQCKIVVAADRRLESTGLVDSSVVWGELQTILVASANISKMLWGGKSRLELRRDLGVTEDSPLRDRELRNDFEHFDERLESWYRMSEHGTYVGRNIGPFGSIPRLPDVERFQHYNSETGIVSFFAHAVSIPDLVREAARILPIAEAESKLRMRREDFVD
jgi:hypothetical protein